VNVPERFGDHKKQAHWVAFRGHVMCLWTECI